jgi:hypothetical protein
VSDNLKIYNQLALVQAELKAPKGQFNNFGKYNYRSCEDIVEAVKPINKSHDILLTLSDTVKEVGGRVYVEAMATITSLADGSSISVTASAREAENKKGMDDSQITGAASSYARKYALNGLYAIDDTKDADTMKPEKEDLDKKKDHTWEAGDRKVSEGGEGTLAVFSIAIQALTTKDSAHKWKKENQSAIDSLGADKGKVMTEYLNKVKELK